MREVLSRFEETEEVVAVSEARIEPVVEELAFPKLDGVLFPMVVANADVIAPCPWMGGAEVSLSEALNNYYQLMSEENADTVIADVNDFLANQVRPVVTTEEVKPETEIKSEIETSGSPKPEAFTETVNDFALKPATEAEAVQAKEAELEKQPVVEQEPAKYAEYTSIEQPDPIKEAVTGHEVAISDREDVISVIEKPEVDDGRDVTAEKASGLNRETFEPEDVFYVPRHDSAPEVREQATREEAGLTDGAGAVEVHAEPLNNMTVVVGEESVNIETDERLIQDEEFETEPAEKVIIPQRGEPEGIEPKPKNRLDLSEVVENEIVELEVDESLVAPQEIRIKEMEAEADVNLPLAREAVNLPKEVETVKERADDTTEFPEEATPTNLEQKPIIDDSYESLPLVELLNQEPALESEGRLSEDVPVVIDHTEPSQTAVGQVESVAVDESPETKFDYSDSLFMPVDSNPYEAGEAEEASTAFPISQVLDNVQKLESSQSSLIEQVLPAVENVQQLIENTEQSLEIEKFVQNSENSDEIERLNDSYIKILDGLGVECSPEVVNMMSLLTVGLQAEDAEVDIFSRLRNIDESDLVQIIHRRTGGSSGVVNSVKKTLSKALAIGRSAMKLYKIDGSSRYLAA